MTVENNHDRSSMFILCLSLSSSGRHRESHLAAHRPRSSDPTTSFAQHSTTRPRCSSMPSSSRTPGSRSVSRSIANDHNPNAPMTAAATALASDLHVLVEAALSPELFLPILAAASLAPAATSVPTSGKLSGNPSLIALSYSTSSVAAFEPISAVQLSTITGCVDQYESVIVTITHYY
jgi:hypothetical protein